MKTRAGSPWIRSPLIGASLFFLALTLLVFRRLLPRLGEAAPAGADMLVYLWDGWWVHRALLVERVSPYWTDWINWPSGVILLLHSLALSVVAPWVWLAQWCPGPTGAVRAHNAAVLSSFVLTGVGVYALAARESGSRLAALVAAIPFCFSAQRFFLIGRLDLLGTQWVVFFVVAFLGALRGSVRAAVAGGVVAGILAYNNLTHLFFAGLLAVGLLVTDLRGARRSWRQLGILLGVQTLASLPLILIWVRAIGVEGAQWSGYGIDMAASGGLDPRTLILPQRSGTALDRLASWLGDFPQLGRIRRNQRSLGIETVQVASSLGYSLLVVIAAGAFSRLGRGA